MYHWSGWSKVLGVGMELDRATLLEASKDLGRGSLSISKLPGVEVDLHPSQHFLVFHTSTFYQKKHKTGFLYCIGQIFNFTQLETQLVSHLTVDESRKSCVA